MAPPYHVTPVSPQQLHLLLPKVTLSQIHTQSQLLQLPTGFDKACIMFPPCLPMDHNDINKHPHILIFQVVSEVLLDVR